MKEISFVAKIHVENGYSFYLPTKIVKWLGLEFSTYNNTVYIYSKPTYDLEEIEVDCTATRHRETWKFSFYKSDGKGLKTKTDYLFRIPIRS